MRASQYLLSTLREAPAEAEITSHQLMIRAGYIRKLASGLYTWLPTGKRVLNKVEQIVREEMDKSGALECLATVLAPAELWQETGRYYNYGDNLMKMKDRKQADFVLGPTHEEVFTDLVRNEVKSYRQLPLNLYQIQTKFRDEFRPRFGVLRTREFLMMDAYSFHTSKESLQETYDLMHDTYCKIFDRCGLKYRAVDADNGSIGGTGSKEFQVLAEIGEDTIAYCEESDYAANLEKAEALPSHSLAAPTRELTKVHTPNIRTIDEVCAFLNEDVTHSIKLVVVEGATAEHPLVAFALRGDHQLNEVKAANHPLVAEPLTMASEEAIKQAFNAEPGSLGIVNCPVYLIADKTAAVVSDFSTGANETDYHYVGANWDRDGKYDEVYDVRNAVEGDPSPDGKGTLKMARGIECGHIFQLGKKYSEAMKCTVTNEEGVEETLTMGCYGIGVTRIISAAIEQNHDQYGICLPDALAPFKLAIIGVNYHKSEVVKAEADRLYQLAQEAKVDTLLDDRGERLGAALADADLIGVPYQIIIGEKNLNNGLVEFKDRKSGEKTQMSIAELETKIKSL